MIGNATPPTSPWRAGVIRDFAASELFERTFQEGMDLVEETAAYLDGSGRQESKLLSRNAALSYASQSMRLTTLAAMLDEEIGMQTTVIVGNSQTFVWRDRMITPRGYSAKYGL